MSTEQHWDSSTPQTESKTVQALWKKRFGLGKRAANRISSSHSTTHCRKPCKPSQRARTGWEADLDTQFRPMASSLFEGTMRLLGVYHGRRDCGCRLCFGDNLSHKSCEESIQKNQAAGTNGKWPAANDPLQTGGPCGRWPGTLVVRSNHKEDVAI